MLVHSLSVQHLDDEMVLLIETVFMLVLDAFTWLIFALLGWPWMDVLAFFLELFHVVLEGKIAHVFS